MTDDPSAAIRAAVTALRTAPRGSPARAAAARALVAAVRRAHAAGVPGGEREALRDLLEAAALVLDEAEHQADLLRRLLDGLDPDDGPPN